MFKITLIACGNKMPSWVEAGVQEYAKRLKEYLQFTLIEVPLLKRSKSSDINRLMEKESALMLAAIPENTRVIALDSRGESFSTEKLSIKLQALQQITSRICFLIGGPEGLAAQTLQRCDERWSLSLLTLPHPLVRVVLLETLYRSFSLINHHPYHK